MAISARRASIIERGYQAYEREREKYDPKRFKRGGGYGPEEVRAIAARAGIKRSPSNRAMGKLELHRFMSERPERLFAYYKGDLQKTGATITNFTGEHLGHVMSVGRIYRAGRGYPQTRMLPLRVKAITGDVYSGVANLDTGTYVKLKKVSAGPSASRHEAGQNPRVSAPLKKRIDRVLGRGRRA